MRLYCLSVVDGVAWWSIHYHRRARGHMTTQNTEKHAVIAIEGLIGCGKSTLARWIRRNTSALVADECESPLLTKFYGNPHRWSFACQIDLLTQRAQMLRTAQKASSTRTVVLDRSVCGDRAFSRTQWQMGHMDSHEYHLYNEIYATLLGEHIAPDIILYLDVPTETAIKRIRERGRAEKCDFEYIIMLQNAYEDALSNMESRGVQVMRHRWDRDLSDPAVYSAHAEQLLTRLMLRYADQLR